MATADVETYRCESSENTPPRRGNRGGDALDIEELCRRLEAYRLEIKLEQVRQRSKQLQEKRSSTLAYRPRYTSRLSLLGGDLARPATAASDVKSRRQSRYIDSDKSDRSDRSDRGDKSDDDRADSVRSSQWEHPKQLLSPNEALHHLSRERSREKAEMERGRKAAHRRSFFPPEPQRRPSSSHTTASDKEQPRSKPSTKSRRNARPLSTSFENATMPDLGRSLMSSKHKNVHAGSKLEAEREAEKQKAHDDARAHKRGTWRTSRPDWAQERQQTCANEDAERQNFLTKLARRSSRFGSSDYESKAASRSSLLPSSRSMSRLSLIPGRSASRVSLVPPMPDLKTVHEQRLGSVAESATTASPAAKTGAAAAREKRAKRPAIQREDSGVGIGEKRALSAEGSPKKKSALGGFMGLFRRNKN